MSDIRDTLIKRAAAQNEVEADEFTELMEAHLDEVSGGNDFYRFTQHNQQIGFM
ncbi:MAG: hypothetical protein AAFX85_01085 [Pseudomonadota bacterium]